MSRILQSSVAVLLCLGSPGIVHAQATVIRKLACEAAEAALSRGGRVATRESVESLTGRIHQLARVHGDDVLVAVRRSGPEAVAVLEKAGPHSHHALRQIARHGDDALWVVRDPQKLNLIARYGDEAGEALIRHRTLASEMIENNGKAAARALSKVNARNARRLTVMARDGALNRTGKADQLLEIIGKYGDRAAEFIWKNKHSLAVASVVAAFVANPEPFLDGLRQLGGEIGKPVVVEITRQIPWTLVSVWILSALSILSAFKLGAGRLVKAWRLRRNLPAEQPTEIAAIGRRAAAELRSAGQETLP